MRAGRRAGDVVERLRGLSRKGEPQRLPLQINDLVADTLALLRREMKAQDVTLKVGLARHLPAVKADRVQLQQVLINLLINAMQAMQATPRQGRDLEVRTAVQEDGTEVLVAIIDSGCGIANVEAQLFNPFFTTKSDGIGMGLSICRSIIEAHGGRIWPSRNMNAGSTFQFALPAYESQYQ